ncbi:MAG: hypothetical protein EAZ97_10530 [Bacteroidetes bacterium]|nr:MAG: hypothetical protein EAZ97_10530 [Bacteroidota bacterium]
MLEKVIELVGAKSELEAIYWIFAIASSGFLAIRVALNILGVDFDHDIEFDHNDLTSAVVSLFCIGGWTGVLAYQMTTLSPNAILGTALLSGILGAIVTRLLLKMMKTWESSGNLDIKNAIGKIGTVYLTIPANRTDEGQIQVEIQGRLVTIEAMTEGEAIPTGEKILVFDVENGKILVTKVNE